MMFICAFTSMDTHTIRCTYMCVRTYLRTHICVCAHIYVHISVCTHIFTRVHVWIFMKPMHNLVLISRHEQIMTNIVWLVFRLNFVSSCMILCKIIKPIQYVYCYYCVLWKKGVSLRFFDGNQQLVTKSSLPEKSMIILEKSLTFISDHHWFSNKNRWSPSENRFYNNHIDSPRRIHGTIGVSFSFLCIHVNLKSVLWKLSH